MNTRSLLSAARPSGPTAASALLDRDLDDTALAALADPGACPEAPTEVPRDVWEAALLGPARDILARPGKRFRGVLVELAHRLGGGTGACPPELPLAIEVIHAGSLVIDDVQDDSSERRGAACLHRLYGVPLAINTGNWMYFWPLELVTRLGLPRETETALLRTLVEGMSRCHYGQALDLSARIGRVRRRDIPAVVAATSVLKTGALMALAASVGAQAAAADEERVATLARFGRRLGVGLQMLDDFGNLAAGPADPKRYEDLRLGRPTWPWSWAARDLDDARFSALEAESRVLQAKSLAGAPADGEPLAASLRAAIGLRGRRAAGIHLERALSDLRRELGPSDELSAIGDEIARLEASYG